MPWIISEIAYKPGLQGVEFSLANGPDHVMFLMTAKAIADYFHVAQSQAEVIATFQLHQRRIEIFAARVMDSCPLHKGGHKLLNLEVCEAKAL